MSSQKDVLSIAEIEEVAASFKEDLQRQVNQAIRKKDLEQGTVALGSMEAIDTFVYTLKMRAGSDLHKAAWPPRARDIRIFGKKD